MIPSPVHALLFFLFAALAVAGGCVVAFARNIVHSGFALLATFVGVAGLYAFLSADFLAIVQVMVYVGGVLILILFALMLTSRIDDARVSNPTIGTLPAAFLLIAFSGLLVYASVKEFGGVTDAAGGRAHHRGHRRRAAEPLRAALRGHLGAAAGRAAGRGDHRRRALAQAGARKRSRRDHRTRPLRRGVGAAVLAGPLLPGHAPQRRGDPHGHRADPERGPAQPRRLLALRPPRSPTARSSRSSASCSPRRRPWWRWPWSCSSTARSGPSTPPKRRS